MMLRRFRRWRYLLLGLLFCLACVVGWGWSIITPEIGQPFVSATPTALRRSSPAAADTPPAKLWSFGFVGDTHAGLADGTIDQIFARFAAAQPEFVLHLGDMVDVGASDAQWDAIAQLAHQHQLRLMPVVGNHDVHRGYPSDRGEIRLKQYFPQLPETFYSFRHRGLNFLMLNSERSLVAGTEQAQFIDRQLRQQHGPTIVCLHRPVFTCGKRDLAFVVGRRLWLHRALLGSEATCVLTGHNHYYERTRPLDGITYVVSGGGTANQYAAEQPNPRTAQFVSGRGHLGLVDVYADHLAIRVVDLSGQALDAFELPIPGGATGSKTAAAAAWGKELPPLATILGEKSAPLPNTGNEVGETPPVALVQPETMPRIW